MVALIGYGVGQAALLAAFMVLGPRTAGRRVHQEVDPGVNLLSCVNR